MFWLNSMYNVCMLNKKGYKNMFNLQNFLNTHEVTVTNLKTLLKNGVKTVKLYDEECDCFEEQTVDIQNLLDNIEDSIYVDKNKTHQIKQIVIKGLAIKNKEVEKWSIQKI